MDYIDKFIQYKQILEKYPDNILLKYCIEEYEINLVEYLEDFIDNRENFDISKKECLNIISIPIDRFIEYNSIKITPILPIMPMLGAIMKGICSMQGNKDTIIDEMIQIKI